MPDPRLFGRRLDLAETAVLVRVRNGCTLLGDPPPGTDAALNRINVVECADLDAAVASAASRVGTPAPATPYLLLVCLEMAPAAPTTDRRLIAEVETWRRDVDAQGRYVMGSSLGGIEAAATQRLRDASTIGADTPFNRVDGLSVAVEVVLGTNRGEALALAATHPLAERYAVEVRPFLTAD